MPKTIRDAETGKFAGSIGDGKNKKIPTSASSLAPVPVSTLKDMASSVQEEYARFKKQTAPFTAKVDAAFETCSTFAREHRQDFYADKYEWMREDPYKWNHYVDPGNITDEGIYFTDTGNDYFLSFEELEDLTPFLIAERERTIADRAAHRENMVAARRAHLEAELAKLDGPANNLIAD